MTNNGLPDPRIELCTDTESSWTRLDGEPLKDGEVLHLEWPDGTEGDWRIRVVRRVGNEQAFVEDEYLGVRIEVPICGLPAHRVTPAVQHPEAARLLAEAQRRASGRRKVISEEEAAARVAAAGDEGASDLDAWVDEDAARDYARENPGGEP